MSQREQLENPFPGLRPFEPNESHLFFGRDGQSNELLLRLSKNRFLAVVGPSGSGKSSLVRAGLLPILHGGFMAGASSHWRVAMFRPGADPIGNLAEALSRPGVLRNGDFQEGKPHLPVHTAIIEATLRGGSPGLAAAVRQARLPGRENLLLVVDQFEELFRFKDSTRVKNADDEAEAFVKLLLTAVAQKKIPIYIVITMRSDFLGDCARFRDLPEAINDSQYLIPRMTRDQRREAITGPVAVSGAQISPRLVQRLLNDMGDDPDQLPILQHALMRTWNYWRKYSREGEPLDVEHYEKIGGMKEALSIHADEAYGKLAEGQTEAIGKRRRELAEKLFCCITELGSDNREMRRPTLLKDVCRIVGAYVEEMKPVIETFRKKGRSFLMPPVGIPLDDDSLIDISHESLIRHWKRLKKWVKKEAEDRDMYVRIADAAQRYNQSKGGLLHNPDLNLALAWQRKSYTEAWAQRCLPDFELDNAANFLEESKQKRDADIEKEKERQKQELKRTRRFATILSVALIIVVAVGTFAWLKYDKVKTKYKETQKKLDEVTAKLDKAEKEKRKQIGDELKKTKQESNYHLGKLFEEKAGNELKRKNVQKAWLYTLEALNQDIGPDHSLPLSFGRLLNPEIVNGKPGEIWEFHISQEMISSMALSPDGKWVAFGEGKEVRLGDFRTGKLEALLEGHSTDVLCVAFSLDGEWLVSRSKDGTILLWDVQKGKLLKNLGRRSPDIGCFALNKDGTRLATGKAWAPGAGGDKIIEVLETKDGETLATLEEQLGYVTSVAFSPDGKQLAFGLLNGNVCLWNVKTEEKSTKLKGPSDSILSLNFSPDGKLLASGAKDNTVRLWDVQAKKELHKLEGHSDSILSLSFSPDGTFLASGAEDNIIRLWDVKKGEQLAALEGHSDAVLSLAFSPDGKRLVSGSKDKTVRLWNLDYLSCVDIIKKRGPEFKKLYDKAFEESRYRLNEGFELVWKESPSSLRSPAKILEEWISENMKRD